MAGFYADSIARHVEQARVIVTTGRWTALQVGSSPMESRRHVRIQIKGKRGQAVAVSYANADNTDGSFTTPTANANSLKNATVYTGGAIWVEPVGDNVTIFGRMQAKAGVTDSSVACVVTEFA